jgi:hypothetical protein
MPTQSCVRIEADQDLTGGPPVLLSQVGMGMKKTSQSCATCRDGLDLAAFHDGFYQ